MNRRAKELLTEWHDASERGVSGRATVNAEELRAVVAYVTDLEAEVRRLRTVVEGVDYELSKALDGTGISETVERIRRVLRDARPVPRPSD